MIGGTIVSITATGLGVKFIRRKIRKRIKQGKIRLFLFETKTN